MKKKKKKKKETSKKEKLYEPQKSELCFTHLQLFPLYSQT